MTVLAAGQRIADRYQLDRRIAVGGMGEVWEASDTRLGRSVAVKVLRPELSDDPEFLHRFQIEAQTVASLDHAGIAAVHDYGEDESSGRRTVYLVMELVRGEPLSAVIARGPIETDEALRIVEETARALQAAHARGFVHRDVKPGNILVREDGLIKLTDFGIAKAADAVPVTRSGMVMGTAHYIAPEQASGSEAGPAGDVYSLGIVGYECLAGHRPFRAESAVAVAMMQVRDEPPPLPDTVPLPARELIESVLVKDPALRYGSGGEFADAVAAVRRGEPVPTPGGYTATGSGPVRVQARPTGPGTARGGTPRSDDTRRPERSEDQDPPHEPAQFLGPQYEGPQYEGPHYEGPQYDAPRYEGPQYGSAQYERPHYESTQYEGPQYEGPQYESTRYDSTRYDSTRYESTPSDGPQYDEYDRTARADGGHRGSAPQYPDARPAAGYDPYDDDPRYEYEPGGYLTRPAARPSTEPLRLQPASGASRGLLLVLFVLLTIAAVVVGIFVLRGLGGGTGEGTPAPGSPQGSGALALSAALPDRVITTLRRYPPTGTGMMSPSIRIAQRP